MLGRLDAQYENSSYFWIMGWALRFVFWERERSLEEDLSSPSTLRTDDVDCIV